MCKLYFKGGAECFSLKAGICTLVVVVLAAIVAGCAPFLNVAPPDLDGARLGEFQLPRADTPQYRQIALDAYNAAAKVADYSLLGALRPSETGIILSGFPKVTPALLEGFLSDAQQLPILSSSGEPPLDYERGAQLLSGLSVEQIQSWLVQLAGALREGRFDLVYERLLRQERGFLQLRDGIMYLLPRSQATPVQARQLIRSSVEEVASATDPQQRAWELAQLMDPLWIRVARAIRAFYESIFELNAANEADAIKKRDELKQYLEAIYNRLPLADRGKFKESYEKALEYILDKYPQHEAGRLFLGMHAMLQEIDAKLKGKPDFVRNEIDKSVFHFFDVINVVEQHGARIVDIGRPIADTRVPLVLHKTYLMQDGRSKRDFLIYFAPFSGPLTHHWLAKGEYNKLVISWINAAANDLINQRGGIVGVHFIDGKPAEHIIKEVQGKFANSNVAIIISWTDASGKLHYECIGALCGSLHRDSIRDQACLQAGRGPGAGCDGPTGQAQPGSGTTVQISPAEAPLDPPPDPPPPMQ